MSSTTDRTRGIYRRVYSDDLTDRAVNSLSMEAELTRTRLMLLADDYGNLLVGDIDLLLIRVYPRRRTIEPDQLSQWLDELAEAGMILEYQSSGESYIHIYGWDESQPAGRNGKRIQRVPMPPENNLNEAELPNSSDTESDPGESRIIQNNPDSPEIIPCSHTHTHAHSHAQTHSHSHPQDDGPPEAGDSDGEFSLLPETIVQDKPSPPPIDAKAVEAIWLAYPQPRRVSKPKTTATIKSHIKAIAAGGCKPDWHDGDWPPPDPAAWMLERVTAYAKAREGADHKFTPQSTTFFNQSRYADNPDTWRIKDGNDSSKTGKDSEAARAKRYAGQIAEELPAAAEL